MRLNRMILPVTGLLYIWAGLAYGQGVKGEDTRVHSVNLGKSEAKRHEATDKLVLIIGEAAMADSGHEMQAALWFADSLSGYEAVNIPFRELRKSEKLIRESDILWFHRPDTVDFTGDELNEKCIRMIREYVNAGGGLVLTLDAFRYLNPLGLEKTPSSAIRKPCTDEGYGRKLGFHSFLYHPVFEGLHGGSYVMKPTKDMTFRVNGYFGDTIPENGKVVAIDWDYIFFREHSKLILEYSYGSGKVVAIGGYTLFSVPNENRVHLEQFMRNVFGYVSGDMTDSSAFFWDYSPGAVKPCPNKSQDRDVLFAAIPEGKTLTLKDVPVEFPMRQATGNFWDLAGERIVVMGEEQSGLEEVWVHPFMAMRDYEAGIIVPGADSMIRLSGLHPEIRVRPDCFIRYYHISGDTLMELVAALPGEPSAVIHYEWHGRYAAELVVTFRSNLRLMWPYPAEATGEICYRWDPDYNAWFFGDKTGLMQVMIGGNQYPKRNFANPGDGLMVDAGMMYDLYPGKPVDLVISAGNQGSRQVESDFDHAIRNPNDIFDQANRHIHSLFAGSLLITSPDQEFNRGYRWALNGTDRFFVHTPGMGSALVAGYSTTRRGWDGSQKVSGRPGYAWYFGRDGQWSGFALLDYGDFKKVKSNLEFYRKYQDMSGKILHEATTSGVIHYDAADATPLYIVLAGRYFRHTGDTSFVAEFWPSVKKAIAFCFSTDTDGDHLIENTGVGHGWVEGGELYGSHSTLYMTGSWAKALEEAFIMAEAMNDPDALSYRQEEAILKDLIDKAFWDFNSGFYSYGMNKDKTFRNDPTILPAVPAAFGLTDPDKTRMILRQYASNAFSTNWGTRIIRDDSPMFRPTGYHYGSVWPLFTGWTALAEYRYGNSPQGYMHIRNNMDIHKFWGLGFVEEVMNGAEYKPSGVCPHQCWSETMVLQPAIEGMLGLDVNVPEGKITIAPRLPAGWDSLSVRNIRFGDQVLDVEYRRDSAEMTWIFSASGEIPIQLEFMPSLPPGTRILGVENGESIQPHTTFTTVRSLSLLLSAELSGKDTIRIQYKGGISVLPLVSSPAPGDPAEGLRILDSGLSKNEFLIDVEGVSGSSGTFDVWNNGNIIENVENGDVVGRDGKIITIGVDFGEGDEKYAEKRVTIRVKK